MAAARVAVMAAARVVVAMEEAKAGVASEEAQVGEVGCSGKGNQRNRSPNRNMTNLTLVHRHRIRHPLRTAQRHPHTCSCSRSWARAGVAKVAAVTGAATAGVVVEAAARCIDWGSHHSQNQGDTTHLRSRCLHRRRHRQGQRRS